MYFLWKRTPHGMIRVSRDGLSEFVQGFLSARSRLYSLAVAEQPGSRGDGDRLMTLVMTSRDPSHESWIEKKLSALLKPLGLIPSVAWASRGSPSAEWTEVRRAVLSNPWGWMALASSVALVTIAGWAGFFWTTFWGTAAWFLVRGLSILLGRGSPLRAASERR